MKIYNKLRAIGTILFFLVLFTGCENRNADNNPYQLMQSEDGRLYRLNKETGQIVLLEGNKIIPLEVERRKKNNSEQPAVITPVVIDNNPIEQTVPELVIAEPSISAPNPERKLKQWGDEQLSGKNLKVSFKSYWQDNKLTYSLEASPYSSLKSMLEKKEDDIYYQRKWHGFIIKLIDANNETVKVIPIKLWDMAKTLDDQGKFSSLKTESEIELLEDEFIRITGYKVNWKLDNILIPEYKFKNKIDDLINTYSWYGEVDPRVDSTAPAGAKYWWMTFPDKKKIYFTTEEELLKSYKETVEKILETSE